MCLEKGGCAIFLNLMGEGAMQFYHLGIGGGEQFFLTPRHCLPPPPNSAESYEKSLISICRIWHSSNYYIPLHFEILTYYFW